MRVSSLARTYVVGPLRILVLDKGRGFVPRGGLGGGESPSLGTALRRPGPSLIGFRAPQTYPASLIRTVYENKASNF